MLNLIKKSVQVRKVLTSAKIKMINFHSGSVREFLNISRTETRPGSSQSRMPVLSRDPEEDVPKCSGWEISRIFLGKIRFPGNGILERRPLLDFRAKKLDTISFEYFGFDKISLF